MTTGSYQPRASALAVRSGRQLLAALVVFGAAVASYRLLDRPAALWAHGLPAQVVGWFKVVSGFGNSGPHLAGLALAYPLLRWRLRLAVAAQRVLYAFVAVAASGLAADVLKVIAGRWRPIALFAESPHYGFAFFSYGYQHNSFPSGHATTAGALACALMLVFPRLQIAWFALAVLIAISRVVVGAHYPADVLAGLWLGVVVAHALSTSGWFHDAFEAPRR